jgi:hypothetical protein
MGGPVLRRVLAIGGGVGVVVALVGAAYAVSSGGYTPARQDCPNDANANNAGAPGARQKDAAVPGCHNFKLNVEDGRGNRYAQFGIDQIPNNADQSSPQALPHAFDASVDANGAPASTPTDTCAPTGSGVAAHGDLTNPSAATVTPCTAAPGPNFSRLLMSFGIYLGADDNLDFGEHDGVSGAPGTRKATNGPSDGGAIVVNWHPRDVVGWGNALVSGDASELFWNPVSVADAGEGECADGYCTSAQTRRRTVYEGGNRHRRSRNVYDYSGKQWDPYSCSSGSQQSETPQSCGGRSMDDWRKQEAQNVYAEPGVQVYEDPDPQASPLDPVFEAGVTPQPVLYPIPAAYAGTCGVTAGGGPVAGSVVPPGTPGTNSAGQVSVSTGC